MKLVTLYVNSRIVIPLRLICLMFSFPFFWEVLDIIQTGEAVGRYTTSTSGEFNYYSTMFRNAIIGILLFWLAVGGIRKKK